MEYLKNCFRKRHMFLIANLQKYQDKEATVWDGSQIDAKERFEDQDEVKPPVPKRQKVEVPKATDVIPPEDTP